MELDLVCSPVQFWKCSDFFSFSNPMMFSLKRLLARTDGQDDDDECYDLIILVSTNLHYPLPSILSLNVRRI